MVASESSISSSRLRKGLRRIDAGGLGWVEDIDAVVAELRSRGVVFGEIDAPGFEVVDGIIEVEGNYPSKGEGERGIFFHDSEGNLLALGQAVG